MERKIICQDCQMGKNVVVDSMPYKENLCNTCYKNRLKKQEKETDIKKFIPVSSDIELDDGRKDTLTIWILKKFHENYSIVNDGFDIYIFKNNYYQLAETIIRNLVDELLDKGTFFYTTNTTDGPVYHKIIYTYSDNDLSSIVTRLGDKNYIKPEQWNTIPETFVSINCKNGILFLNRESNWNFVEHKDDNPVIPNVYFDYILDFDYNPSIECPVFDKLLSQWVNPNDINFVHEWIGYHLMVGYPYKKFLFIHGAKDNGKTQFLTILENFIGKKNVSNQSIQRLSCPQTDSMSYLYRKKANIMNDMSGKPIYDESILKALTGNDTISAPRKYKNNVDFKNEAKITGGGNDLPLFKFQNGRGQALFQRMIILQFPNYFDGSMPDIYKTMHSSEYSGLLNHAIDGLNRLQKNCGFSTVNDGLPVEETYNLLSNNVYGWIINNCVIGVKESVLKDTLINEYIEGCKENITNHMFMKKLNNLPFFIEERKKMINGVSDTYIYGLSLKKSSIMNGIEIVKNLKIPDEEEEE